MAPPAQPDRYEPLPSLLEIPGFLIRKMGRRGRRAALAVLVLFVAGLAVTVPVQIAAKHDDAAARAAATARARTALIAKQRAEIRPVAGGGAAAGAAVPARRALVTDLSAAVEANARARVRTGEFARPVQRADCTRFPPSTTGADPITDGGRTGRYACLAVTAEFVPGQTTTGGAIGYPYRALVDFETGRFTFCKTSGRPGEGSLLTKVAVPVPHVCGGTG